MSSYNEQTDAPKTTYDAAMWLVNGADSLCRVPEFHSALAAVRRLHEFIARNAAVQDSAKEEPNHRQKHDTCTTT